MEARKRASGKDSEHWNWALKYYAALCSVTSDSPMDCSLPGFSVRGIFPERIPEWVAIFSSKKSSLPRDQIVSQILLLLSHREAFCNTSTILLGRGQEGLVGRKVNQKQGPDL